MDKANKSRCVYCRTEMAVPERYAHGDHIKCGTCGTKHKVMRGEVTRLVLADVAPLREKLVANQALIERLQDEINGARRSFGIGVNGIGIGFIYFLVQIAIEERTIEMDLAWEAIFIAIGVGAALELANYLFLAKRQRIQRLSADLENARLEGRQIQKLIREAGRV